LAFRPPAAAESTSVAWLVADNEVRLAEFPGIVVVGASGWLTDLNRETRFPEGHPCLGDAAPVKRNRAFPGLNRAIHRQDSGPHRSNDAEGNPFQPGICFGGFTASPVAGTPQGIARVCERRLRFKRPGVSVTR